MNLSPPKYQHSSITEGGTIRLILLEPSKLLDNPIQCSLIHVTLEELDDDIVEHYVALSYVWGDANNTRTITIDGCHLDITASLDTALRHIRDAKRVLRVWADGICINQQDASDRNQQVSQMGPIYAQARHTIIFIGESTPECDAFMRCLRSQTLTSEGLHSPPDHSLTTGLTPTTSPSADHRILEASWFTRVWVLQELVLSPDPWLQCGSHRVRWSVFSSAVLSADPPSDPQAAARVAILRHMDESRTKYKKNNLEPGASEGLLLDLLAGRKGFGVSDPRDMIYAHLGLTDSATRAAIPVDYSKSVVEVYEHVAGYLIQQQGLASILSQVGEFEPENKRECLPSWVPDWTAHLSTKTKHDHPHNWFKGSEIISTIFPSILGILGSSIGTIITLFPFSFFRDLPDDISSLLDYLSQPNPTIHFLLKALLLNPPHTLLLNRPHTPWYDEQLPQELIPKILPPVLESVLSTSSPLSRSRSLSDIVQRLRSLHKEVSDGQSVAILHNNRSVIIPSSSRIGDTIGLWFNLLISERVILILRPWNPQPTYLQNCEDKDIESKLLQDINILLGKMDRHHLTVTRVQQCQFVAIGGREWPSDPFTKMLGEGDLELVAFALH